MPGLELSGRGGWDSRNEAEEVMWVGGKDMLGLEAIVRNLAFIVSYMRAVTEFWTEEWCELFTFKRITLTSLLKKNKTKHWSAGWKEETSYKDDTYVAWLFEAPQIVARQASLSVGFPRQEYWRGLPFSPPGDFCDLGIKPTSPASAGRFFTTEPPGKPYVYTCIYVHVYIFSFRFFPFIGY